MPLGKQGNITKTLLLQSRKAPLCPALHHKPGSIHHLQLTLALWGRNGFSSCSSIPWSPSLGRCHTQAEYFCLDYSRPRVLPRLLYQLALLQTHWQAEPKLMRWCCNPKSTSDVTQVTESQQDSGIVKRYPVVRQGHHPLSYSILGRSATRHPVWWAAVDVCPKGDGSHVHFLVHLLFERAVFYTPSSQVIHSLPRNISILILKLIHHA